MGGDQCWHWAHGSWLSAWNWVSTKDKSGRYDVLLKSDPGVSLVAQWWRIRLPVQETRVRSLVLEDPTCHRATKPVSHFYWACALEPMSCNDWAHLLQRLKPGHLQKVILQVQNLWGFSLPPEFSLGTVVTRWQAWESQSIWYVRGGSWESLNKFSNLRNPGPWPQNLWGKDPDARICVTQCLKTDALYRSLVLSCLWWEGKSTFPTPGMAESGALVSCVSVESIKAVDLERQVYWSLSSPYHLPWNA